MGTYFTTFQVIIMQEIFCCYLSVKKHVYNFERYYVMHKNAIIFRPKLNESL